MNYNCLIVPLSQINKITVWLDRNNYSYFVDEFTVSFDDTEEKICINIDSNINLANIKQKFNLSESDIIFVLIDGKHIASNRREIIDRGIDILLQKAQLLNIDWNKHDLSLRIVERKRKTQ